MRNPRCQGMIFCIAIVMAGIFATVIGLAMVPNHPLQIAVMVHAVRD